MKLTLKNIVIQIILVISILTLFPVKNYAEDLDDTFKGADSFVQEGQHVKIDTKELASASRFLYNAVLAVGIIVTVVVGIFLGIKYMTSAADEQAQVKEMLIPYVVSCGVIFGAFTIWKIIINVLG